MKSNTSIFNTNRMVKDYTEKFYRTAHRFHVDFSAGNFKTAREFAAWKSGIVKKWDAVSVRHLDIVEEAEIKVGSRITVKAEVGLDDLSPDDVRVELYFGNLDKKGDITEGVALPMVERGKGDSGSFVFEGQMLCLQSGRFGFTVRVLPNHPGLARKFDPDLRITWA